MAALQKITPCLFFDQEAEEAAAFYVSLFEGSSIRSVRRYPADGPFPEGRVMLVEFTLGGVACWAINGGPMFKPTEATSLVVACEDQEEIDRLWDAFSRDGGEELACGWVKDRWGFSWQITPAALQTLLSGDAESAARVMRALWAMKKIEIAGLEAARDAH